MVASDLWDFLAYAQSATGLAWAFACACRINLMTQASHQRVRVAVGVFGAGGFFFAAAPWAPAPYHMLFDTLAGCTVVASQWVTAALWRHGVPYHLGGAARTSQFPPTEGPVEGP